MAEGTAARKPPPLPPGGHGLRKQAGLETPCLWTPLCRSPRAPCSVLQGLVAGCQDTLPFLHPGRTCGSQSPRTSSQGLCWDQGQGPGQQPAFPASLVEETEVARLRSLRISLRFAMHWLLSSRAQGSSQKNEVPAPAHLPPHLPPSFAFLPSQ